jgi:hypothetical protein
LLHFSGIALQTFYLAKPLPSEEAAAAAVVVVVAASPTVVFKITISS